MQARAMNSGIQELREREQERERERAPTSDVGGSDPMSDVGGSFTDEEKDSEEG